MKETKKARRPKAPPFPGIPEKPREMRCDARLAPLTEDQRRQVVQWLDEEGEPACRQHIEQEFQITVSRSSVYAAVEHWRRDFLYVDFLQRAQNLANAVAARKGNMSLTEIEEWTDFYFIVLASDKNDPKLYQELRYLRIADQESKNRKEVAKAKVRQGDQKLKQGDKALALEARRVALLETKAEDAKDTPANDNMTDEERSQRVREILRL